MRARAPRSSGLDCAAVEEGDVLGYEEERMVMGVLGVVNLVSGPYLLVRFV